MALAALLQAVRDELRYALGVQDAQCEVQSDGQPPPGMGADMYISVHPIDWKPTSAAEVIMGIDESYKIGVTVTKRISSVPADRKAREVFLKSLIGFEALARRIMVAIHQNVEVLNRANAFLEANHEIEENTMEGVIEWLRWESTEAIPTPRTGEWLFETRDELVDKPICETITITFSQARRVQRSTLME